MSHMLQQQLMDFQIQGQSKSTFNYKEIMITDEETTLFAPLKQNWMKE